MPLTGNEFVYPFEQNNTPRAAVMGNFSQGITLRQHYAGLAMQGLATLCPGNLSEEIARQVARESVLLADEMIKALNQ
jgi:hypothetical protein